MINSVQAECHVKKDSKCVFAAINQMRKRISGIIITSQTLQCTPDPRQSREKSEESRMGGITLAGIIPILSIEAEEELNILISVSF